METKGILSGIYRVSEKVMLIAYINILWIMFSLLGLVIFGIMPATVAMFAVIRKQIIEEEQVPIFSLFLKKYKEEFVKVNLFGYLLLIVGTILWLDVVLFQSLHGMPYMIMSFLAAGGLLLFLIVVLYILPLYVHYDLRFFNYIKTGFLLAFSYPIHTAIMIVSGVVIYFILLLLPGSLFFFSGSLYSFIILKTAFKVFSKVEKQKGLEGGRHFGSYSI
jgi:uncharacterized membrane protein YesL